jgi:hypothetical protein
VFRLSCGEWSGSPPYEARRWAGEKADRLKNEPVPFSGFFCSYGSLSGGSETKAVSSGKCPCGEYLLVRFSSQQDRGHRYLLVVGSSLIGFALLSPAFLAAGQPFIKNIENLEDEVYCLLLFSTLLAGHAIVGTATKRKRRRLLSFACMLLCLLGVFPVYALWAAPAVEFCTLGVLGVLSLLVLAPPLGILSIITVVLSMREVLSHPVQIEHCEKCGYNLNGLVEPRCPECGTPFDPALLQQGPSNERPARPQRSNGDG